jgi:hypothetical protein
MLHVACLWHLCVWDACAGMPLGLAVGATQQSDGEVAMQWATSWAAHALPLLLPSSRQSGRAAQLALQRKLWHLPRLMHGLLPTGGHMQGYTHGLCSFSACSRYRDCILQRLCRQVAPYSRGQVPAGAGPRPEEQIGRSLCANGSTAGALGEGQRECRNPQSGFEAVGSDCQQAL